ncbi:hypothetical protein [Paracoccus sp. PAR01]|uniref:spike base protein, RCAP_Rcc01079 family n=1 Tax=Paracoccus sp. PAR01 TaxID=2769282 RepID=UPI00177D4CF8|nr:hypothetical protein [Paracoccus sp. PAR01]MBD9528988.1 hypothetical protein [Paracoccus sp. PAR01]
MPDRFSSYAHGGNQVAAASYAITPNDGADLTETVRAVTIGGAGTISWVGVDGVIYTTGALPVGTYAMRAARIRATGTTATAITGWV